MCKKKKILILILSLLAGLFIVLPGIGIAVVKWGILPPEKLTPLVLNYVNPMVDGEVCCERIELTFMETFPQVGLRITGGAVIPAAHPDTLSVENDFMTDTLLRFSEAVVSVDIRDYFQRNRVTVDRLTIKDPYFYGYIDSTGKANWDIFLTEEPGETIQVTEDEPMPAIDLQFIGIRNGYFIYDDRTADLYTEVAGFNLRMRNKLRKGNLNTDIKTGISSLIFESPAYRLENDLTLQFESKLDMYRDKIAFSDSKLLVNDLPFQTQGLIEKAGDSLQLDIRFKLNADNLADLIPFIPDIYFTEKKHTQAHGKLELRGKINGMFGENALPNILVNCSLEGGSLKRKGSSHGIEKLETDLTLFYHGVAPDSSYIHFRKLEVTGTNTEFSARGTVEKPVTDPRIDAVMQGRIDFEGIMGEIFNPDTLLIKGTLNADIEAGFNLWEIMDGDFSRLQAAGKFRMDRLLVADRIAHNSLFMKGVDFSADTTRRTSSFLSDDDLISAHLNVDTLNIRYGRQISTRIGSLDMQVKTSRTIDTTKIQPATTHIRIDNLTARLPDSVWVSGRNIYLSGGIKASSSNPQMGMFGGRITLDTLRYADMPSRTRMTMNTSTFNIEVLPLREAMRQRRVAEGHTGGERRRTQRPNAPGQELRPDGPDSIPMRIPSDSSRIRSQRAAVQQTTAPAGTSGQLLRKWEVRGSVHFAQMRLFTAVFPLPVRVEQTTLKFDTDKLNLSEAKITVGKSDLTLTGELNSIRQALLRGGILKGDLTVSSDFLDCNQLMRAMNRSSLFAEEQQTSSPAADTLPDAEKEEALIAAWEENEQLTVAAADETLEEGLFIVPKNLDLVLRSRIGKADFNDVNLEKIRGEVIVRNQSVNLRRLAMASNIGSGNLTMVYTAKEPQKADVGFELELEDIIVERLLGMFPQIDTLLPMLRSFEGVLDGQLTASCELDSAVNVVFPTLHAACYLNGENMVLLDGETFTEISKKLMFKNKERNIIDYISVDLSVKDNKIEVFPFKVEIDRYTLAVGGLHNLDMTFDYHISVLKSPVPFKLGIDIAGNLDDFKFKVVKCRYKDMFKVAREQELQDTRLNLRTGIREIIRKQLAENAPELASGYTHERIRSRRPETAVTDMDPDEEVPADPLAQPENHPEKNATGAVHPEQRNETTASGEPNSNPDAERQSGAWPASEPNRNRGPERRSAEEKTAPQEPEKQNENAGEHSPASHSSGSSGVSS